MALTNKTVAFFDSDGPLAQQAEAFTRRASQTDMAHSVAQAIERDQTLLAEAGTGTGKTFAYLVPAMLAGKTIMISTATKTLQEQLYQKDAPMIKAMTQFPGKIRLLKGRENYLCPKRLEIAQSEQAHQKRDWSLLNRIEQWQHKTQTGDKAELAAIEENDPIWSRVCARLEFCQANECGKSTQSQCFYPDVKKQANEAEVLIVNHHLFSADLALKEAGQGEVLPQADIYIFDEAHQLPEVAAQFLGFSVSRFQLEDWVRDFKPAFKKEASDTQSLLDQAYRVKEAVSVFNRSLGSMDQRLNQAAFEAMQPAVDALRHLVQGVTHCTEQVLAPLKDRGKLLQALYQRGTQFVEQLTQWQTPSATESRFVHWLEVSSGRFKLHRTPMSVAGPMGRHREKLGGSWILTSATLSVRDSFDYFCHKLGLQQAQSASWPSPFDYPNQAFVYHPVGLPSPNAQDYIKICLRALWPLLQISQGRAFLLFTSHRGLQLAAAILKKHWSGALLVQGDAPKSVLLERFRQQKAAVLLGTGSFWEGVDVKGEDLSLVMIDRLPFMPPDDPMVEAKESDLKAKGLSSFVHYQLPEAVIAMKQGCGRLIRDAQDQGVLVLCDPRLKTKSYGQLFINSLPKLDWVYDAATAKARLSDMFETMDESVDL